MIHFFHFGCQFLDGRNCDWKNDIFINRMKIVHFRTINKNPVCYNGSNHLRISIDINHRLLVNDINNRRKLTIFFIDYLNPIIFLKLKLVWNIHFSTLYRTIDPFVNIRDIRIDLGYTFGDNLLHFLCDKTDTLFFAIYLFIFCHFQLINFL